MAVTLPPAPPPAALVSTVPVLATTCGDGHAPGSIRPRDYFLSCDSSDWLSQLRWSAWTSKEASAAGTEWLNDCEPDCADGHYTGYPVRVTVSGLAPALGNPGRERYVRYSLTYLRAVPPGLSRHRTGRL